jgi:D-alanyl-D-alanine carboxypeptidase
MKKIVVIIFCSFTFGLNAQSFSKEKMDSLFTRIDDFDKGMGSISIYDHGVEVYNKAYGYADLSAQIKNNVNTKYRIGSVSKMFTATAVIRLIEAGKLDYKTKLSVFFPDIENAQSITIEHLLRHRSGIFNFTDAEDYVLWMENPITKEALIRKLSARKSAFKPGSKADYSNSNYVLLSFILEKIENKPYAEVINDLVIRPCKLSNTYFGNRINSASGEAFSYMKSKVWEPGSETDMSVPAGAGAIVSNPSDENRFLYCLFNGQLVSAKSLEKMKTIQDGYGMGMFRFPFYEKFSFGHTGGIDGFHSMVAYFPGEAVSIAYNSNAMVMDINKILLGALKIYFGKTYQIPEFPKIVKLSPEQLDQYLGTYSSKSIALKITITKENTALVAQATGQSAFELDAYANDHFGFEPAGLKLEFVPAEQKMILDQNGARTEFIKD